MAADVRSVAQELDLTDNTASVVAAGSRCTVLGTSASDRLCGRRGKPDVICAGSGNDIIYARDGVRDLIEGGPGVDRVHADPFDRLVGVEHRLAS